MVNKESFLNEKNVFRMVTGISLAVLVLVALLNKRVLGVPSYVPAIVYAFPKTNAVINGTCSILLLLSLYFIKRKKIETHKRLNLITFALSSLFLVLYVAYHYFVKATNYPLNAPLRPLYLILLSTHIVLAGLVLPIILLSFYYGLTMQVIKHKKLVRFTFPIWLYVTVTGVIVYLMISPYYTFNG